MKIEVHIHHHGDRHLEHRIDTLERMIMATKEQALALISAQNAKITKVGAEVDALKTKVAELQAAVDAAGDTVSDEIITALGGVTEQLQVLDDKNADLQPENPDEPAPEAG